MLRKLLPQQRVFFDEFNSLGDLLSNISELLLKAFNENCFDMAILTAITRTKEKAKIAAGNLFTHAHTTFITPFDRHDIHSLNNEIYDSVNTINLTAQRCHYYKINFFPHDMKKLVLICRDAAKLVAEVLQMLSNVKDHTTLLKLCTEIKEHESMADHLLIAGIAQLYNEEEDIKTLMKQVEVYGLLESITDRYQMIAYIAEGIVLEYS